MSGDNKKTERLELDSVLN